MTPARTPRARAARQLAREATGHTEADEYGGGGPSKKRMPGMPEVIRYRSEDALAVLTFGEAAQKLGVDPRQVEARVTDGTLVTVPVGLSRMMIADQVKAVRNSCDPEHKPD